MCLTGRWTIAILVMVGTACEGPARAQDKAVGRPELSGTWTLDSYLSDNPEQVARAIRLDTGQSLEQEFVGGEIERGRPGGIGRVGGDQGGRGGPARGQGATADQISPDDRKKLTELTDAVQFASGTLTISQTESAITITSTRGGTQAVRTDGKAETQQLDAGAVDRVARWEGPTTKQLLIRVNFERRRGQPGPFDIKLVYSRAGQP